MKTLRIANRTRGTLLASHVLLADRWWARVRGYLGRPEPAEGEGILLVPCNAVHTFGMRYPLDVLFLGADGTVLNAVSELRPRSWTRRVPRARYVLELRRGTIRASHTERGDGLTWTSARGAGSRVDIRPEHVESGSYASAVGPDAGRRNP